MSRILLGAAGLTAVYLLVLSSAAPGDVLVGGLLGLAVAFALRPRGPRRPGAPAAARGRAAAAVLAATALEMVHGSARVVRLCLGGRTEPGLVEIPRGDRSAANVALWGVLTGLAPDEVVVDVDEDRAVLIVHAVEAGDPDAMRARHREARERQRTVVA